MARNANFLGSGFLSRNIGAGCGIFADADEDKPRGDATLEEGGDAGRGFAMNLGSEGFSIEDAGGHVERMQRTAEKWKREEGGSMRIETERMF
jgi:hypothetical protein